MAASKPPLPSLQIVHISDLHFHVGTAPQQDQIVRRVIAALSRAALHQWARQRVQWLSDHWEDGRAGHARDALIAFECFFTGLPLPTEPAGTPPYLSAVESLDCASIPTWLVDTGDLSSVGDDASIRDEIAWIDRMAKIMNARETLRLYGNHDAWPNKFPLISNDAEIAQHRTRFRSAYFPSAWPPVYPRSIALGSTGNRIDVYEVNSVIHDRFPNLWARGQIRLDPHWGGPGSKDQLGTVRNYVC